MPILPRDGEREEKLGRKGRARTDCIALFCTTVACSNANKQNTLTHIVALDLAIRERVGALKSRAWIVRERMPRVCAVCVRVCAWISTWSVHYRVNLCSSSKTKIKAKQTCREPSGKTKRDLSRFRKSDPIARLPPRSARFVRFFYLCLFERNAASSVRKNEQTPARTPIDNSIRERNCKGITNRSTDVIFLPWVTNGGETKKKTMEIEQVVPLRLRSVPWKPIFFFFVISE